MAPSYTKPHEISISDNLWEVFTKIAECAGTAMETLINQAMFEMAVKLGYITPIAHEVKPPLSEEELRKASPTVTFPKFTPGKTKELPNPPASRLSLGSMPTPAPIPTAKPPTFSSIPPTPGKRPPRPSPRATTSPGRSEEKGLFVVNKDGDSEIIDKDIFIIGRSSKCDLVINSVKVSREHAIITRERSEYFIEDLGSANGTWYRGERIEKIKINDGDEIFICDERFTFVMR
jgi:FOG: FHA domain